MVRRKVDEELALLSGLIVGSLLYIKYREGSRNNLLTYTAQLHQTLTHAHYDLTAGTEWYYYIDYLLELLLLICDKNNIWNN